MSVFVDYTARDQEVVDYDFCALPGVSELMFRGPVPPLDAGRYFTCIGAAQTLGTLAPTPYPQLTAEAIGIPALNLGLGGGGPRFFASQRRLIEYVNAGRFLILQVMAARAEPNARFHPSRSGRVGHLLDTYRDDEVDSLLSWERAVKEETPARVRLYVAQSRNAWVASYLDILAQVTVPVILFWFADKDIDEPLHFDATTGMGFLGGFPHLVDRASLAAVRALCAGFASCASSRNRGHPYVSRFTGAPVTLDYGKLGIDSISYLETHNHYYHTQEMHADAVPELLKTIETLGLAR